MSWHTLKKTKIFSMINILTDDLHDGDIVFFDEEDD